MSHANRYGFFVAVHRDRASSHCACFAAPASAFLFRFGDDPHRCALYVQNFKFEKLLEGPLKRILIVDFTSLRRRIDCRNFDPSREIYNKL